jgi:hypothetical protein
MAAAWAGAWAQPRNAMYAKAAVGYTHADQRLDADGDRENIPYKKLALYLYGEYGVLDRLTAVLAFAAVQHAWSEAGESFERARGTSTAFLAGDIELQAKFQFWDAPVLSALVGVKLPVGYSTDDQPPLGTGKVDVDARLAVGGSFHPIPAYATGDFGYRLRLGDFADELVYNVEAGYFVLDPLLVRLLFAGIHGLGGGVAEDASVFALRQRQHRIGGGLLYRITDHLEADVTYYKSYLGSNALDAHEIFVGFAVKAAFFQEAAP